MDTQHNPASNDYGDINVAFDAGFNTGWRSGCRYMARAASRFRPKPSAPVDKPNAPDKLNGHAQHVGNGNGSDSEPMLPL